MKLFVEFLQKQIFEDKLKDYKDIDFSLFVQTIPKSQDDLSSINIISSGQIVWENTVSK